MRGSENRIESMKLLKTILGKFDAILIHFANPIELELNVVPKRALDLEYPTPTSVYLCISLLVRSF